MNLVILLPDDFVDGTDQVRLGGRRLRHVREILRATVGDELCVGVADARMGLGRITRLDDEVLEMDIELSSEPPAPLPLTLVLALPRPLVLKRTLIAATSMGVKRIILVNPRRVDRSFWSSTVLREESIREQLILGLEQARDTRLPEVLLRPRFRPFVEEELPALVAEGRGLIAHPGGHAPCPRDLEGPITLAVGPEGGFSDYEVERFEACGMTKISLGERILRVETVLPVLLAKLF